MAKGTEIIVSAHPKGVFEECIISGTPKPGTCMEIVPDSTLTGGRHTYRGVTGLDGATGGTCVLLPDSLRGKLATEAYASGDRGFLYWPVNGEELNMLLRDQPGTGTSLNADPGDRLEVDGTGGLLQGVGTGGATGSHERAPFVLMENLGVDLTADTLVWVKYLGNG